MRWPLLGAALLVVAPAGLHAQRIRASQEGYVRQKVGETWLEVHYRRPTARGRELFGGIVGWGRTWTPGADTATTLKLSAPIRIEEHSLPAGTYSVWMIPDSTGPWTVIFSRAQPVFHIPYPGEEQDQLRLTVTPQPATAMETLAFYFSQVDGADATLAMHWGTTVVPMRIHTGP